MSEIKLLPCPFCGTKLRESINIAACDTEGCIAHRLGVGTDNPRAVAAWNRRARTDADLSAAWVQARDTAAACYVRDGNPAVFHERIRSLTPPPDLGAALATALEQARREEREACDATTYDLANIGIGGAPTACMISRAIRARTPTTEEQADG